MKRVKPKMTHNDRFFFSQFCVGLSLELALRALLHERAISQLQVASENSLLCAFQFHTNCWSFFWGVLCLATVFLRPYKSQKVNVSQAGSQRNRIRKRKVLQMYCLKLCLINLKVCWFMCKDLKVDSGFKNKIRQGHTQQGGHWFISITSIIPHPSSFVSAHVWHNAVLTH